MYRIIFISCLIATITGCQPTTDKTTTAQTAPAAAVQLNEEFVKKLQLPATISYMGLEKPADTLALTANVTPLKGMIVVPGGLVQIGSETGLAQEQPAFWAKIKPFMMDIHPVTVAEFRKFVAATGFKTEAEKFGNAGIITEFTDQQWILQEGATWHHPLGSEGPAAPDNHPVTQVSWNDANAYAKWMGKRLPCEIEWEHAARNGRNSRDIYPWGNDIQQKGQYMANIWQGKFPQKNFNEDGFFYTSPVGKFGTTPLGLTDMSGNVWEWQSNWKFNYEALFRTPTRAEDISNERAERGGSFLCEPTWCHGYRVSGRSSSTPETSLFHVGFRCVKDI